MMMLSEIINIDLLTLATHGTMFVVGMLIGAKLAYRQGWNDGRVGTLYGRRK